MGFTGDMTVSRSLRGAPARRIGGVAALLAVALLGGAVARANAQASSGGASTPRARASDSRDSARVRRAALLIRFDSLRQEFEHARLSDAEREGLENEMHRTMMALQESMN